MDPYDKEKTREIWKRVLGEDAAPAEIDAAVMETKLASMGLSLERMTDEQRAYMADWRED